MSEADTKFCPLNDAKFLYNQLLSYYLNSKETDDKFNLLKTFVKNPDKFKHMDLIRQLETDNLTKIEPLNLESKK